VLPGWTWHAELVRQLIAERDDLRADAERYRWLRKNSHKVSHAPWVAVPGASACVYGDDLDAEIDAARKVTS
jgi:hypothetical protein